MDKNQQEKYEQNMIRVSGKGRKSRRSILSKSKKIIRIARFVIPFLTSPMLIVITLFVILIGGIFMMFGGPDMVKNISKVPTIVLSKDKVEALGLEIYQTGDYKGKIKGCENLEVPDNIYSSFVESYADNAFNSEQRMMDNFCLYHMLYIKQVSRYYEFEEEKEVLEKINDKLKDSNLTTEEKKVLNKEKNKITYKISEANNVLKTIPFENVGQSKFKDYESDDEGFKGYIDFPVSYFENNTKDFLDMLYYDYIGSKYGEAFSEGITLGTGLFDIFEDDTIYYNMINELGLKYNSENIATELLPGNYGLPNFSEEVGNRGEYYNFPCPPCKKEVCSCTGDPEEDYNKNFKDEEEEDMKHYKNYLKFIYALRDSKVIYVSENVKSPFRDYIEGGRNCNVDVKLTQRDGPSNLRFGFFKGYPKINGVRTHAGIDLASTDNCNGDEVPVYSITEGTVFFKSYSSSAWGYSIIVETQIKDETYYVRYSHLDSIPEPSIGEFVTTDTLIGIQGDSGPSTAEHLDVTIYKGGIEYSDYLRDTLNWGGLFNFSFTDMIQNGFSDYTISSFNGDSCYNCK